jgi:hypothetical protein
MQPIGIRRGPARSPSDAVELLLACHGRIRQFTALAVRLLDAHDAPADQIADAGRSLARYWGVALPLHVADEDVSIAHRVAPLHKPVEVVDAIREMTAQHLSIDRHLDALVPAWTQVAENASALQAVRSVLEAKTPRLAQLMPGHLEIEESTIFPWMRASLSTDDLGAILAEMRERRAGVALPHEAPGELRHG